MDTVHSVRETGTFKNQAYARKYEAREKYSSVDYHNDDGAYKPVRVRIMVKACSVQYTMRLDIIFAVT